MVVVLDIETVGAVSNEMRDYLIDKLKAPGNVKDPEKIKRSIAEKAAAIDEKAALSPLTGEVAIVGLAYSDSSHVEVISAKDGGEERLLVTLILRLGSLRADGPLTLVTYNGKRFDLPFLAARAAIRGIFFPVGSRLPSAYSREHIDLYDVLGEGSLEQWAIALGMPRKKIPGAEIPRLIQDGKWEEAEEHCLEDIKVTLALYNKVASVVDAGR